MRNHPYILTSNCLVPTSTMQQQQQQQHRSHLNRFRKLDRERDSSQLISQHKCFHIFQSFKEPPTHQELVRLQ